jgi:hypothetical protein
MWGVDYLLRADIIRPYVVIIYRIIVHGQAKLDKASNRIHEDISSACFLAVAGHGTTGTRLYYGDADAPKKLEHLTPACLYSTA